MQGIKQKLCDLQKSRDEIKALDDQIAELQKQISVHDTTAKVKGSDVEHPYTYHSITVHGIDIACHEVKEMRGELMQIQVKRRERIVKLKCCIAQAEEFIAAIEEYPENEIFRLRYLEKNLTWRDIAQRLMMSESGVKMRHNRYIEKAGN